GRERIGSRSGSGRYVPRMAPPPPSLEAFVLRCLPALGWPAGRSPHWERWSAGQTCRFSFARCLLKSAPSHHWPVPPHEYRSTAPSASGGGRLSALPPGLSRGSEERDGSAEIFL